MSATTPERFVFCGGETGGWRVERIDTVAGEALAPVSRLAVVGPGGIAPASDWALAGVTSNLRYTTGSEAKALAARQPPLGRLEATCGALIPIRKTQQWWGLPQDRRRAIYEERSRHTTLGLEYLPRIARRLHHSRDLGEPFDFLTWFEFAPEHETAFDELLARLRATEEWAYVDREIELRVRRS